MDAIELSLFSARIDAICDEMGAVLRRAAFSPNIRDRQDFSCALFDPRGELAAQAAHIPVHLGSMAFAMADIVSRISWRPGDMVVLNDPYLGGTHLPDVTVVAPLFFEQSLLGFVANRAHHADIGAETPGSMPISTRLDEEGVIIPPTPLVRNGRILTDVLEQLIAKTRSHDAVRGDFSAQVSANRAGLKRLEALIAGYGANGWLEALAAVNDYAETLAGSVIDAIPDGIYRYTDVMDDDGFGNNDLPISVNCEISGRNAILDFAGTSAQVAGNINCPFSVAAAAVFYVFRCLMPSQTPACAGSFRRIRLIAPERSLVNAERPAAVAAGNVETSTRIVDAVLGALAQAIPDEIPAASHGSMNNLAMGSAEGPRPWDYYETLGGGMGGHALAAGLSAVQTHMTNTLNTPIETLEMTFPLRIRRYAVRTGSGGAGRHPGGAGLIREYEFLAPAVVTLLTERRRHAPWGLARGEPGQPGRNLLDGEALPAKTTRRVTPGSRLVIETAGGGGWGAV